MIYNQLSIGTIANHLNACSKQGKYLCYDKSKNEYLVADRMHNCKLSFQEILDLLERHPFENYALRSSSIAAQISSSIQIFSRRTKQKYYQRCKLREYFHMFLNGISGRRFETVITRANRISEHLLSKSNPDFLVYKKGEKQTKELIPTEKKMIGKGECGKVYLHRKDSQLAVKKTEWSLNHEFSIGSLLNHLRFVKVHKLYEKVLSEDARRSKLVMDRIIGFEMAQYSLSRAKLSKEKTIYLVSQIKECTDHLFQQKIVWSDLNDGNMFNDIHTGLKICDYGLWRIEEDETKRAGSLLLGAMEAIEWILKNSILCPLNESLRSTILAPKQFFGKQHAVGPVCSIGAQIEELDFMKPILNRLDSLDCEGKKSLIREYIDAVIENC